ncbi:MAG: DUF2666 family protein [Candidatus Diapherotrites archaeon]|nr:DUF2666 family protein [Candidatus Diapherotrites archaeon]
MEGRIEFFAQTSKWVVVKKLRVDDTVKDLEIARFLASVHETMDRKMWEYMSSILDAEKLDGIAAEVAGAVKGKKGFEVKGRVGEEKINEALARLKSPKTTAAIKELAPTKTAVELGKAYVFRRVLEFMGFPIEVDAKLVEKVQGELRDAGA